MKTSTDTNAMTDASKTYVLGVTDCKCRPVIAGIYYAYPSGERVFGAYRMICEDYAQRDALVAQIIAAGDHESQLAEFDRLRLSSAAQ